MLRLLSCQQTVASRSSSDPVPSRSARPISHRSDFFLLRGRLRRHRPGAKIDEPIVFETNQTDIDGNLHKLMSRGEREKKEMFTFEKGHGCRLEFLLLGAMTVMGAESPGHGQPIQNRC